MTVVINKPANGAVLKGTSTVEATYTGLNFEVATLTIDGKQLATDSAQPISFAIDSTKIADGARTIVVAVRYRKGGTRRWDKASITVTVDNAVTPVPTPPTVPAIPTGLKAVAGDGQVTLSWNAVESADVYQVYLNDANHKLDVQGTSYVVTGLTNGTTYNFRVSAHNSVGYGDWTDPAITGTPVGAVVPPPDPQPQPPQPSTAYFVEDWSTGKFESVRWAYLNVMDAPGWVNAPTVGPASGRVKVVSDPAGSGKKCVRLEIRDSDADWAAGPGLDKEEVASDAQKTWGGSFSFGTIRWFEWDIYFPYTADEKFEFPHGADQPYFKMHGLHPPGPTGWSAIQLGWEAFQWKADGDQANYKNIYLPMRVEAGTWNNGGPNPNDRFYNLLSMTDANGNRIMANHNRWVKLVWGVKFNYDSTGWFEAWVDGKNVVPRHSRPTSWNTDGQNYFKYGLYRRAGNTFPESGRTVVYYGRTAIGKDRPF